MSRIRGFHAHVYFSAETFEQARTLCEHASKLFTLKMGRLHTEPVGPHPDWSCQLAFRPAVFGELVPWLALNRGELVIFVHPITRNELADHRDHAIWMGEVRPLDLSTLNEGSTEYEL